MLMAPPRVAQVERLGGNRRDPGCSLPERRRPRSEFTETRHPETVGGAREDVGMTAELTVPALAELRLRRSVKWRRFPGDVLPLFVAETDYLPAPPVAAVLSEAVTRGDIGYSTPGPELGKAF